jgi:hypothetical protein
VLGLAPGLGINELGWSELFGSSLPSALTTKRTNPTNTDISTADTIELMELHTANDISHPIIQQAIADILSSPSVIESDPASKVQGVYDYVKERVTFVEDEATLNKLFNISSDVELLITPARLLSMNQPMGDCDDFSMLTKALLSGMGIQTSFVTVGADRELPGKWSHVYCMATLPDGKQIPVDTSHGKFLGWEAPGVNRKGFWINGRVHEPQKARGGVMDATTQQSLKGIGEIDWGKIIEAGMSTAGTIAKAQFGQPQMAPGTYIRNADGSLMTNQPGQPFPVNVTGAGISSGMILLAVVGIGLLLALKR